MSICGVCNRTFKTQRILRNHKRRVHGGYFTKKSDDGMVNVRICGIVKDKRKGNRKEHAGVIRAGIFLTDEGADLVITNKKLYGRFKCVLRDMGFGIVE